MPVRFARLLSSILCGWAVASAHAQPGCHLVLSGRVIDIHDRQPLPYAEVFLPDLGKGAVADQEGRFALAELCPGTLVLQVNHLGCAPVTRTVQLFDDMVIEIRLEHHVEELKEFEVLQQRPDEHVGQSNKELDKAAMEKDAGRTLGEMLARIPGVGTLQSGPTISKPVIHGLSGNRILTLNQGIRQEDQQWGTEHAPNLDPLSSDRITVVKGAASVQYGSDALGGVVITEPVELPRDGGISGEARVTGMLNGRGGGGNALLQSAVKGVRGLGWRVQGSGRCLGDSEAPAYVLGNTGVREAATSASVGYRDHRWNANAYYSWFLRELGILRASHIGNLTDLNNAIASGVPWTTGEFDYAIDAPRQTSQHHLLKAEAGYALSDRDRIVLTYGYQSDDRQEYDIRRAGRSATPALDLLLRTHTADVVLKHWIGKRIHGKVGFSGAYQRNSNIPGTGVRPLIPNYLKQSGGVFLLEHFPIATRVEMEAGARIEATRLDIVKYDKDNLLIRPEHDFVNSAFSVGANWSVRDSVRLRFNLGSAYRPPHVSELYSEGLHHGAAAIEEGDAGLRSERSFTSTLDLEAVSCAGRLRTDLTLYANRIEDYIYLRPEGVRLTVRGAFPVFRYVAANAMLYGIDASVQYRIAGPWSWRMRASTVHGRELEQDEWLFQLPADRVENAALIEVPEAGRWRAVEVAVSSLLVFAQARVPADLDFSPPPDGYHLVGISASASRALGKGELRTGLSASNLLNQAYRDYLDRFRYYADARGTDIMIWVRYAFGKR